MKSRIIEYSRHFLTTLLITLAMGSAHAIQSGPRGFPASQTPLLLKEFKTAAQDKEKSEWGPVQYLSYNFAYVSEENVVGVFAEIGKAMGDLDPGDIGNLHEFKNLQKEMVRRGYEPAVSTNWVKGKRFIFSYDDPNYGDPGPIERVSEAGETTYTHQFTYEYHINFQKKGRPLESFEFYPRVTLNGTFVLECKTKWDDCRVLYSTVRNAQVNWDSVPGYKTGGNSSAGGGPRSTFSMDKAMLSKEEIEKISKSQRSK